MQLVEEGGEVQDVLPGRLGPVFHGVPKLGLELVGVLLEQVAAVAENGVGRVVRERDKPVAIGEPGDVKIAGIVGVRCIAFRRLRQRGVGRVRTQVLEEVSENRGYRLVLGIDEVVARAARAQVQLRLLQHDRQVVLQHLHVDPGQLLEVAAVDQLLDPRRRWCVLGDEGQLLAGELLPLLVLSGEGLLRGGLATASRARGQPQSDGCAGHSPEHATAGDLTCQRSIQADH